MLRSCIINYKPFHARYRSQRWWHRNKSMNHTQSGEPKVHVGPISGCPNLGVGSDMIYVWQGHGWVYSGGWLTLRLQSIHSWVVCPYLWRWCGWTNQSDKIYARALEKSATVLIIETSPVNEKWIGKLSGKVVGDVTGNYWKHDDYQPDNSSVPTCSSSTCLKYMLKSNLCWHTYKLFGRLSLL